MRQFVDAETAASPGAGTPPPPLSPSPSADRIPDGDDCDLLGGSRSSCGGRVVQLGAAEPLPLLAVAGREKHQRALRPSG